ncbi:MAG: hypothetical protein GY778_05575 [bacterium]|nr:hypothetical protein [bacterium]
MGRDWSDDRQRWHYIRLIVGMLQGPYQDKEQAVVQAGYTTARLIDALNAVTQTYHGRNGYMNPGGFDRKTARETIAKWTDWARRNDPYLR